MSLFIFINLFLIGIIVLLLIILSWVWPPDSPWAPWWKTKKEKAKYIVRLGTISEKDVVYELGSGDGEVLLEIARLTGAKCVGLEIDPLRFWISKFKLLISGSRNVKFIRSDFKNVNIEEASVIYVYLVPKALEKLLPKFKKELRKGTRVISYKYEMGLKLKKKERGLLLYTIT